jgi:hypothetical protein
MREERGSRQTEYPLKSKFAVLLRMGGPNQCFGASKEEREIANEAKKNRSAAGPQPAVLGLLAGPAAEDESVQVVGCAVGDDQHLRGGFGCRIRIAWLQPPALRVAALQGQQINLTSKGGSAVRIKRQTPFCKLSKRRTECPKLGLQTMEEVLVGSRGCNVRRKILEQISRGSG